MKKVITRISLFGDEIEKISRIDSTTGEVIETVSETVIYPAVHYLADDDNTDESIRMIREELKERLGSFILKINSLKPKGWSKE